MAHPLHHAESSARKFGAFHMIISMCMTDGVDASPAGIVLS